MRQKSFVNSSCHTSINSCSRNRKVQCSSTYHRTKSQQKRYLPIISLFCIPSQSDQRQTFFLFCVSRSNVFFVSRSHSFFCVKLESFEINCSAFQEAKTCPILWHLRNPRTHRVHGALPVMGNQEVKLLLVFHSCGSKLLTVLSLQPDNSQAKVQLLPTQTRGAKRAQKMDNTAKAMERRVRQRPPENEAVYFFNQLTDFKLLFLVQPALAVSDLELAGVGENQPTMEHDRQSQPHVA